MDAKLSRNSILPLACAACCLLLTCPVSAAEPDTAKKRASVEARLKKLDPFFKQHVVVGGTMVAGSEKVSRRALEEVAYLARKMLANRPDVLNGYTRLLTVLAYTEMQSALPACRGMNAWWDYRARGLAGSTISCGEENVLCLKGDPWAGENIFIHEFGHGLNGAFNGIDKGFQKRLDALHGKAKKSGLFRGYGIRNASEFWAESVQAWFNCNGTIRPKSGGGQSSLERIGPKGEHIIHITRREHVKKHLPGMARLLDESFRQNKWTYVPVSKRLHEPHLKGFDPEKAPTFRWPEGLAEKFQAYEAQKKIQAKMPWAGVSIEQILAAKALGIPVAFENSIGMRFVLIPAGEFMMGSKDPAARVAQLCAAPNVQAESFRHEHPRHKVTLTKAFYMSIHEVTQKHYEAVTRPKGAGKAPRKYPGGFKGENMPAGNISWRDGEKFCKTLSKSDGRTYALPTEAQWEYACRARTDTPFSFGPTISNNQANYDSNYVYDKGKKGKHPEKPMPAGKTRHNAWGLYDMHGNLGEWCADAFGPYPGGPVTDPKGPAGGKARVVRGGSWRSRPGACRSAFRSGSDAASHDIGLRVVCVIPTK